jgi:hypothetical protein
VTVFRLPVSGLEVWLRQPSGADDIVLAEAAGVDRGLAQRVAGALVRPAEGGTVVWGDVTLTDLDAALLALRRLVLGDRIASSARCTAPGCGAPIDLGFRVTDYLAQHAPRTPRNAVRIEASEWYRLDGSTVSFRLPTSADLDAITDDRDPERELARRCIRPADVSARIRRRIERAMESLAPSLYGDLAGACPECGAIVHVAFDPQRYVLEELRQRAVFVFEEIHLIARGYRWTERAILQLPRQRRARYAELIHEAGSGG